MKWMLACSLSFLCVAREARAEEGDVAPPEEPAATAPQPPPDPYDLRKRLFAGGGITLGIGLVQLSLGIYGAVVTRESYDIAAARCEHVDPPWGCPADAIIEMDDARNDALTAIFGLGFGSISTVAGTVLLAVAPSAPLRVTVVPQREGAALLIGGTFQ